MKNSTSIYLSWLTVISYAFFIFSLSAIPSPKLPESVPGTDKIAHLLAYLPLGFFLVRALASSRKLGRIEALLAAVFVVMLYALSDEIHQFFVPGRMPDILDWSMDSLGGLMGGLVYRWPK